MGIFSMRGHSACREASSTFLTYIPRLRLGAESGAAEPHHVLKEDHGRGPQPGVELVVLLLRPRETELPALVEPRNL